MPVNVRRARPGDEDRVAEMAIRLFEQHVAYDPKRFTMMAASHDGAWTYYRSRFDTPQSAVMVAEIDNEVIGFAYVELQEHNYADLLENAAWLQDIFVDDRARKTGAGRKLADAAIEWATEAGAARMVLHVAVKNQNATKFFEVEGFRPTMTEMTLDLDGGHRDGWEFGRDHL